MRHMTVFLLALAATVVLPVDGRAQVFHGVVLDRDSQKPVLVCAVTLIDYSNKVRAVGITDSVGRYQLAAPEPGRYQVRVDPRGYRTASSGEYIVEAGDTVEVNVLVSADPNPPTAATTRRRALSPGCVPPLDQTFEKPPDECGGRWAVEVFNCFDQPINVYNSGEGETLLLGRVAEYEYAVLYSRGSARPVTSVGHSGDWGGFDFRERSRGLVAVRVYCDPYWRTP
ncbi:MAG: carboxypeptidase regulatory-like domain-containing protein [Gemmatimonadota bacterium]|nr:MAG: carboxypeptidase regulatory-like domain-containing protein [Gemmatimonadota bacterium]